MFFLTLLSVSPKLFSNVLSEWYFYFFLFFLMFIFERERDRAWAGEGQRERKTQNPKQVPGSELSAQSPTRGSNPQTVRSWPELKPDAQPRELPRRPPQDVFMQEVGQLEPSLYVSLHIWVPGSGCAVPCPGTRLPGCSLGRRDAAVCLMGWNGDGWGIYSFSGEGRSWCITHKGTGGWRIWESVGTKRTFAWERHRGDSGANVQLRALGVTC